MPFYSPTWPLFPPQITLMLLSFVVTQEEKTQVGVKYNCCPHQANK